MDLASLNRVLMLAAMKFERVSLNPKESFPSESNIQLTILGVLDMESPASIEGDQSHMVA